MPQHNMLPPASGSPAPQDPPADPPADPADGAAGAGAPGGGGAEPGAGDPPQGGAGEGDEPGGAPGGDQGDDGDAGADPDGAGRRRGEERIRELIAERNATAEYGEYWRNRALELMRASGQLPPGEPGAAAAPKEDPAPKLEDFDSTEKWAAAYTDWSDKRVEQRAAAAAKRTVSEQQESAQRSAQVQAWQERLATYAQQHPDVYAVLGNQSLPFTQTMTEVVVASDHGPALAYHLGRNPAEAARISRMSPANQAAALGRLEAQIAAEPPGKGKGAASAGAAPGKRTSKAPPPPSPIDGAGTPSVDLENCSLKEFLDRRLGRKRSAKA